MPIHTIEDHIHGTFMEFIAERDHLVRQIAAVTGRSYQDVMHEVRMANPGRPNTVNVLAALRSILADAEEKEHTSNTSPF